MAIIIVVFVFIIAYILKLHLVTVTRATYIQKRCCYSVDLKNIVKQNVNLINKSIEVLNLNQRDS